MAAEPIRETLTGKAEAVVTPEMTAKVMGSGSLEVLATPAVVALMENASCKAIEKLLPEGMTTVGTMIQVQHISATPVSMKVYAVSRLVENEGRKYVFETEAYDEKGKIAEGTHERFLVRADSFMKKTLDKKKENI